MVRLSEPIEEIVLAAMLNHHSNIHAVERIQASGIDCRVITIAKHETEAEETLKMCILSSTFTGLLGKVDDARQSTKST